ncbi:DUF371 domain-containing protein [Nanoarchaeota archaeon]
MKYEFSCQSHKNILGTHKTTLEFTKDSELSKEGDCIIGIKANFDLEELKKFLKYDKLKLTIECDGISDSLTFKPNPEFNDNHELVIRTTDFISERTFGIKADKAAKDLSRELLERLNSSNSRIRAIISF